MAPSIVVEPAVALIDVERSITISGFPAYSVVTVKASMQMCGIGWRSSSVFLAGQDGSLDLERDCPVEGDYAVPSSMGIVWSMTCDDVTRAVFPPNRTDALDIYIEASDGHQRVQATLTQTFVADGVQHESVRTQHNGMSISGELYTPATPGPHPLVIYMNGSSGGVNAPRAALFAAHGYQCLALGIFNYEGRPRYLNNMPLEYFQEALSWARETLQPRDGFVALSGISRGAETSLLVASQFPDLVSAVIAYVPSFVMHGVVSAGEPDTGRNAQVWTLHGEPLPHVWQDNAFGDWDAAYAFDPPYRQTKAFMSAARDGAAFERARIPVERFPGPTMLISASDDGFWPSTAYSELIAKQRESHDLPTEHYICEGAGHHVHYPYLPTTLIAKPHAMSGLLLDAGGTAAANAAGYEGSYWASLDFLERAQQLVAQ